MDPTASLPSTRSNSKVNENQISFGSVDFQPHPPTLPVFQNLDREMDLMIESFNLCIGSLGTLRLLDPNFSGPSTVKTATVATSESSVGSSSAVNSSVSIRPAESKRSHVDPLDEIMENLDLKESSDRSLPNSGSEKNFDYISNYS
jgi:hypothetical protein